ncbi:relaxase/mobilization nuclease domain-containing protein [Paraburkholderia sp. A1RI-2L]|uniref:TraI/MobA(P) family conjugative relaxase n=1 Tax=Paraburkholderia sp. A1RI-2L TaxID=3028367 RepID=UPI003B7E6F19
MIAKQIANRHDGHSDFGTLAKYITSGMTDAQLSQLATDLPGFGQLTQYVAQETDDAGKEKCVAVSMNRLLSVGAAPVQFFQTANRNPSVKNPVIHLVVSWPEHERPSYDAVFAASRDVLKSLNLHEHQWLMAIHNDTDNLHCHIEVSRIHPETFKSQHLPWMHKTLHRAAREIEIKHGWSHDNGLFVVRELPDGRKFVVPNDAYKETKGIKHEAYVQRLDRMEAWSDERSLVDHCRDVVTNELVSTIAAGKDWDAVHSVFEKHGMRIEKAGSAAFRLEAMTPDGEIVKLPVSKALRAVKFGEVESVIGPFKPSGKPLQPAVTAQSQATSTAQTTGKAAPPKRDPLKREARRLERAAERTALIERFKAEQSMTKANRAESDAALRTITTEKRAQVSALKQALARQRHEARQSALDPSQRKALYSLLAFERARELARISAEAEQKRALVIAARVPSLSWRAWLEREAKEGDAAALSALRGIVYQERRDAKKAGVTLPADESVEDDPEKVLAELLAREREEDAIRSAQPNRIRAHQSEALMREISGLRWKVTNNGNVEYRRESGATVFVDKGNKLTFDRKIVTDADLALALFHAREKWSGGIVLTAGDTVFTQRMVKAAVAAGITVKNPELQQMQAAFQAQRDAADGIVASKPTRGNGQTKPNQGGSSSSSSKRRR